MKNPLDPFLAVQPLVVMDGALATELEALGADLKDPLWSAKVLIESPALITQVHTRYLEAGADILCTASYQATYAGFSRRGIQGAVADHLFRESIRLAHAARSAFWEVADNRSGRIRPLIAASIGPYGAFLANGAEYHGNYGLSREELIAWHRPQVEILTRQEAADFLLFETIPSLLEAQAIVELMEAYPAMAYALSFSCRDGAHLSHGEPLSTVTRELDAIEQLIAVGINCTAPEFITPLLQSVQPLNKRALMVYPNSGEVWDAARHCWRMPENLVHLPARMERWYREGARVIGGCCRTTPAQIREIRTNMVKLNR